MKNRYVGDVGDFGKYGLLSPNPPKRWAVAMTQRMMGKGRRTGLA